LLIFCVADCTGHGVPGAFMSMLGVSFLNEIVHKEHVTSAAEVLNHLRDSIIAALKQRGESSEQKDGMDMGLCVINTETRQMQFAGGYNPCWVIPNAEHPNERLLDPKPDQEAAEGLPVIQLKPDKMPIAIHKHMEPYTNHLLQLFPGDQIYLMSDGFQDQFGGEHSKKFMVKNLRELVVANANLPMEQQRKALERALEDWKGRMEQVDDVTILGIRI
jgi:serine phosphatase RsbU (regulator of sigma subunit)